jgi:hypothetical protein
LSFKGETIWAEGISRFGKGKTEVSQRKFLDPLHSTTEWIFVERRENVTPVTRQTNDGRWVFLRTIDRLGFLCFSFLWLGCIIRSLDNDDKKEPYHLFNISVFSNRRPTTADVKPY